MAGNTDALVAALLGRSQRSPIDGMPMYQGGPQMTAPMPDANFVPTQQPGLAGYTDRALYPQTPNERTMANVVRGFAENPAMVKAYHGSFAPNLQSLDSARLGENFPNRTSRQGHWFSTNPEDAAFYGDHVYEANLNGRHATLPSMEQMADEALNKLRAVSMRPNVNHETRQRAEQFVDFIESTRDPSFYTNVTGSHISKAKSAGYDGARLVGGETVQNSSASGDNYVVFTPEMIEILRKYGGEP